MRDEAETLNVQGPAPSQTLFFSRMHARDLAAAGASKPDIGPMTAELLDIHEYERQRMGQELHDTAGQLLVSLQLSVGRLRRTERGSDREQLIEEIQDTVRQIDQEIRALAFLDHPAELRDRELCEAVRSLVEGFRRRTGIATSFKCVGGRAIAKSISAAMLRVVQEALVNIHRHSHASSANVVLRMDGPGLRLSVSDNGIGMPADAANVQGIGLQGMRHRVELHGGRFAVESMKPGTKVSATLPLVA